MTRRRAITLGALVAALAAAELVALTALLSGERERDRRGYAEAIAAQRRAAGTMPGPEPAAADEPTAIFCVREVEGAVVALRRALEVKLFDDGRVRTDTLRDLSAKAVAAERYMERARAAPALPQRMGRERRAGGGGELSWESLVPPVVECDGDDAYGSFPGAK